MPDFVSTVTAAPPAIPCSASKLAVETLTVLTVSAGATAEMTLTFADGDKLSVPLKAEAMAGPAHEDSH